MRHVIAIIFLVTASASAQLTQAARQAMSAPADNLKDKPATDKLVPTQLYPYLVPKEYLAHVDPSWPTESLGHDIFVTLVVDLNGLVRGATAHDIAAFGLDWAGARSQAMLNLAALANRRAISMQLFPKGPGDLPFILAGGHWSTAALILSSKLPAFATSKLGTQDVCVSIPHREALLLFPCGTPASRRAMRALIRQKESNAPKALTFGLFALKPGGLEPLLED